MIAILERTREDQETTVAMNARGIMLCYTSQYSLHKPESYIRPKRHDANLAGAPASFLVPSQGQLLQVSQQSRLSDEKGDNEMEPGTVHRSGICLTAEENPRKSQIGHHL